MKQLTAFFLVCAVLIGSLLTANAAEREEAFQTTVQQLQGCPTPQVGSIGGEWLVIGLARAGMLSTETAERYYAHVVDYVREKGSAKLDRNKATENARVILALTAIDKDPTDIDGYDLLSPLADFSFVKKQGINGVIWTLIALDSLQYETLEPPVGKEATTRPMLIDCILQAQNDSGGWSIGEDGDDPDLTGMALQALAPYRGGNESVAAAINKALNYFSVNQRDDGSPLSPAAPSPESCAQVIVALTSLGIHPEQDARFLKNGRSVMDSLLGFYTGSGFAHEKNGAYNQMSTEQAFYALIAVRRLENGESSLYDMSDLLLPYDVDLSGRVDINDATLVQKYVAELEPLNLRQLKVARADEQGKVFITFATEIQKFIVSQ